MIHKNKRIDQSKSKLEYNVQEFKKMLIIQNQKLYELEVCLQKERREKADLETDYQHLLDQIKVTNNLGV